jgi:DNA mismatch repair protein MutS2
MSLGFRRRLEQGAEGRIRHEGEARPRNGASGFSAALKALLGGGSSGADRSRWGEFAELPLPDLLSASGPSSPDRVRLLDLLDLAFLGRASAGEMDRTLEEMSFEGGPWDANHFAGDLFLDEVVRQVFSPRVRGERLAHHLGFVRRVLESAPTDVDEIRFRQEILAELEAVPELAAALEDLAVEIHRLLFLLRASRDDARLEPVRFRLDVLRAFRRVVSLMAEGFGEAASGLHRLQECGTEIAKSGAFGRLEALLDHDESMARLDLEVVIGADGRLRDLKIGRLREGRINPFYRRPLRRWWDRLRIAYHRYRLGADELVDQMVMAVYQQVAPAMVRAIQSLAHLEVYLAARGMAEQARSRGLDICLPEIVENGHLRLDGLFNPLLLAITERPVPSDLRMDVSDPVTVVTGPNSGGKTRLLQAVGIAQVLGQSGFYVPCRSARISPVRGLFASMVEMDRADQSEGRLGTEMVRLKILFENVPPRSLILLDELCSGTNPSEAVEIVETVLRMLCRIEPIALVTTHFLDFAKRLEAAPPFDGLRFLQAEVDADQGATFNFIPGVAGTSLAVGTARRLGVTFDELERKLQGE